MVTTLSTRQARSMQSHADPVVSKLTCSWMRCRACSWTLVPGGRMTARQDSKTYSTCAGRLEARGLSKRITSDVSESVSDEAALRVLGLCSRPLLASMGVWVLLCSWVVVRSMALF